MLFASMRLAFALVCVGACLILGAHWFGFIPDPVPETLRARRSLSEAIAINAAAHVRKQQWVDLTTTLKTHVDRNPELLSIGIRSDLGHLRVDTGHHKEIWPDSNDTQTEHANVEEVVVPITLNRREWGQVELCYHKPHLSAVGEFLQHPLMRLLAFFIGVGIFSYTLFVMRILGVFNNTQVVPDRVRQALDTLAEGLLVLDEEGYIVLANRAFGEIVDQPVDDLAGQRATDLGWMPDDVADQSYPWLLAITQNKTQAEKLLRYELENGQQRIFGVNAAPLGKEGTQRGSLATFRDVTHVEEHRVELERMLGLLRNSRDEIKRKNAELEILATQDALTGCLNRRAFFETFESMWSEAKTIGSPLSCLMIDVDHFKNVNDTYGHQTGDDVLREVSQVIRQQFAETGLVCRYGGEEFCVVLPGMTISEANTVAEVARKMISDIRLLEPAELRLTASIGASALRFEATDTQDLINQADICLYHAKRDGRNRVVSYNPSMAVQEEVVEEEVENKHAHIDIPYQAVTALVSALSYRDANVAEHSRRVADLCARAADGVLDPAETYVLEIAALLHDIGEVGVTNEPSGGAVDLPRKHRIGQEIIGSAFDCRELIMIISCHHTIREKSLASLPIDSEIANAAKLLTIADGYDAMVSNNRQGTRLTHDEAVACLRRNEEQQYDARLLEHFIDKIAAASPTMMAGAFAIRKQAAIQIGQQIELLADAVTNHDVQRIVELTNDLGEFARGCDILDIANAAEKIEASAGAENVEWLGLLQETNNLLDLCRNTQSQYLRNSLECESIRINS